MGLAECAQGVEVVRGGRVAQEDGEVRGDLVRPGDVDWEVDQPDDSGRVLSKEQDAERAARPRHERILQAAVGAAIVVVQPQVPKQRAPR